MSFYCNRDKSHLDSMERAWYPYQVVDSLPFLDIDKLIIADIHNKPIDIITSEEKTCRRLAERKSSESYITEYKKDEYSNYEEYLIEYREDSLHWDSLAKTENEIANNMDMAIWIQNISPDTIFFPIQDGSLIGVLEAIDNENSWKPIQYWWFSWCGNSYNDLTLLPNNSIQIGVNNIRGEIETTMRLKIHGRDTLYISNEFFGKISLDDFELSAKALREMLDDKDRISFLDSVHYGLTDFLYAPIEIFEFEEE